MSDYTPSTEEVREAYIGGIYDAGGNVPTPADIGSGFDRWMAEHDRQVRAGAWGEGWNVCNGSSNAADDSNPYRRSSI